MGIYKKPQTKKEIITQLIERSLDVFGDELHDKVMAKYEKKFGKIKKADLIEILNNEKKHHDLNEIGCPICYDEIPDLTIENKCGHILCFNCIDTIKKKNGRCPLCRTDIKYFSCDIHCK